MKKLAYRLIGLGFVFIMPCLMITWWLFGDLEVRIRFPDRVAAIPTVQTRLQAVMQAVSEATAGDTFVETQRSIPLYVKRGAMPGCISGQTSLMYRSDEHWSNIVQNLDRVFAKDNWKENVWVDNDEYYIKYYNSDTISVEIELHKRDVPLTYLVRLFIDDPGPMGCYP